MKCIRCQEDSLDLRYMFNGQTYELEYHCTTLQGGCNFYRIIPLDFTPRQGLEWVDGCKCTHIEKCDLHQFDEEVIE